MVICNILNVLFLTYEKLSTMYFVFMKVWRSSMENKKFDGLKLGRRLNAKGKLVRYAKKSGEEIK